MSIPEASASGSTISRSNLRAGRDNVVKTEYHYNAFDPNPLTLLREHAALGALHDAAERPDPPKCHPETRAAVIKRIDQWAQDRSNNAKPILWLHGAAGAGKSAIVQSMIERWLGQKKFVVPHFFFWRRALMRNKKTALVPTLAFQLAKDYPATKPMIEEAVRDGDIFKRGLISQVEALIVQPLQALPVTSGKRLIILVVDGLDECCIDIPADLGEEEKLENGEANQEELEPENEEPGKGSLEKEKSLMKKLWMKEVWKANQWKANPLKEIVAAKGSVKLDGSGVGNRKGGFPGQTHEEQQREILEALAFACDQISSLRVLVSSRPEREIRACFDGELRVREKLLRASDRSILLSLNNQEDIDADVTLFLDCEFAEIRRQRPSIPDTWPSRKQIALLVEKSSGQFIYPSTAVKYIRRRRQYPVKSLEEVLALQRISSKSRKEHPLAELDALYTLVLRTVDEDSLDIVKIILGILSLGYSLINGTGMIGELPNIFNVKKGSNVAYLSRLLFLSEGELIEYLTDLHSILFIPTRPTEELVFFHATLPECLLDQSRSREFFISENEVSLGLTPFLVRHADIAWFHPSGSHTRRLYNSNPTMRGELLHCLTQFLKQCAPSKNVMSSLWLLLKEDIGDYLLIVTFDTTVTTAVILNSRAEDSRFDPYTTRSESVLSRVAGFHWGRILEYLQRCNIPEIEPSRLNRKAIEIHLSYIRHCVEGYPTKTSHLIHKMQWKGGRALHMLSKRKVSNSVGM